MRKSLRKHTILPWIILLVVVLLSCICAHVFPALTDTTSTTAPQPASTQTSMPTSAPTHIPTHIPTRILKSTPTPIHIPKPTLTPTQVPTPVPTPIPKPKPPKLPSNPLQAIAENAGKDIPSDAVKVTVTQKNGEVQISDIIFNLSNIVDYVSTGKQLTFDTQQAIWNKGSYKTVTVLVWFATSDGNGKLIGGMSSVLYPDTEKTIDWGNIGANYAWSMYDDTYISPSLET